MKWIIYTDLDGTLLDFTTYSYEVTQSTVAQLSELDIPVIFCSSKTRAEQEVYRSALHLHLPFIVENGSAILFPEGYFDLHDLQELQDVEINQVDGYTVIALGAAFRQIRSAIEKARAEVGIDVKGYADLTNKQVMQLTGLSAEAAKRAAQRDYSETLLEGVTPSEGWTLFVSKLDELGLQCVSGGKFHTVMGKGSDKGKAVQLLTSLFRKKYGEIKTVGLGDSANDLPLLEAVDVPFLVQKPSGEWETVQNPKIQKIEAIGPQGWNLAIHSLLNF